MKKRDCHGTLRLAMTDVRGFTLIEMLTTTAIMVIIFGLLAIIFGRATAVHKIVRSGGDAENFGIYLMNTMLYGPGTNREKGLIGTQSVTAQTTYSAAILQFTDTNGNSVVYNFGNVASGNDNNTLCYESLTCPPGVDLKPKWASDRGLEVLPESSFYYYSDTAATQPTTTSPILAVGIKLVLKNTLQNISEAITLYRCVRIRNQIEF